MDTPFSKIIPSPASAAIDELELTLIDSNNILTKRYMIGEDGEPRKASDPFLSSGSAARVFIKIDSFTRIFVELLDVINENTCFVLGALSSDIESDMVDITTKDRHSPRNSSDGSPLIWRGKEWLGYRVGYPAVLGLDHDAKDLPEELRARLEAEGGLLAVLDAVCPAFSKSAQVVRPSVSTGIVAVLTKKATVGGGLHVYVPVTNGGDAQNFVSRLHAHLVLAGWGWAFVSSSGGISIRSPIDIAASGAGERLWFEGSAVLDKGLAYKIGARLPTSRTGGLLDTEAALLPLTAAETCRYLAIQQDLRSSARQESELRIQKRSEQVRSRLAALGDDASKADAVVRQLLAADQRGVLNGRHMLYPDSGDVVSVASVILNRGKYHRITCSDPLEPEYGGGKNKAIIYTDGSRARLFSHAHGGRLYDLAFDEEDMIEAVLKAQVDGTDIALTLRVIASDACFADGGWAKVESATGVHVRELLGFSLPIDTLSSINPEKDIGEYNSVDGKTPPAASMLTSEAPDESLDDNEAVDLLIKDFNKQFAVVAEGGTVSIMRFAYNADLGRRVPASMSIDAFRLLYGNLSVSMPQNSRVDATRYVGVSATKVWLEHPKRRTCPNGLCLDPRQHSPTAFNLWQGFGVQERPGEWSKLRSMIFSVLAAGNEEHDRYIIQWLAHLVQRPDESPGVALVFRGEEGVGKGTLGKAIMRLMKPHAMQITHSKHLTGAFNSHMRDVLFLFADEAFFAGDRANEGTLKGLITEQFRVNEGKGRDATLGRNRIHLMMASNNDWVVPASADARRYAVFDVSPIHKQDQEYFGPVLSEMDVDGEALGIAAMLYDLKRLALDVKFVRKAPETAGLQAQRIASMQGPAKWLFDVLTKGYVDGASLGEWVEQHSMDNLYDSYETWVRSRNERYPSDRFALGKFLASMFAPTKLRLNTSYGSQRRQGYRLGSLDSARAVFAERHRIGQAWPDCKAND